MSKKKNKKKKLTAKQLKEKEARKEQKKALQRKNRLLSLIVTAVGALAAYYLIPKSDVVTHTVICVGVGLGCGLLADLAIVSYYKLKENRTK